MSEYPKIIAPGIAVIGRYKPKKLDAPVIGQHLLKLTVAKGLENYCTGAWPSAKWTDHASASEVREPGTPLLRAWHFDRGDSQDYTCAMVIWSNREQTEIKLPDETVLKPTPGDVLLIQNTAVLHRSPAKVSEDRWFFRRFVKVPEWMEIAK